MAYESGMNELARVERCPVSCRKKVSPRTWVQGTRCRVHGQRVETIGLPHCLTGSLFQFSFLNPSSQLVQALAWGEEREERDRVPDFDSDVEIGGDVM